MGGVDSGALRPGLQQAGARLAWGPRRRRRAATSSSEATISGQKRKAETSLFDGVDTSLDSASRSMPAPIRRAALTAAPGRHPGRCPGRRRRPSPPATMPARPRRWKPASRPCGHCARNLPAMGLERCGPLRNRFPPPDSRSATTRMPCWPRTTSPSTPSPTMAW